MIYLPSAYLFSAQLWSSLEISSLWSHFHLCFVIKPFDLHYQFGILGPSPLYPLLVFPTLHIICPLLPLYDPLLYSPPLGCVFFPGYTTFLSNNLFFALLYCHDLAKWLSQYLIFFSFSFLFHFLFFFFLFLLFFSFPIILFIFFLFSFSHIGIHEILAKFRVSICV